MTFACVENYQFLREDFEEMREAGHLIMPVPREPGGLGMTLAINPDEQPRWGAAPVTTAARG